MTNQTPILRGVRRRWWVLVLCAGLAVAAALVYTQSRERDYEASAEILVTPLAIDDRTFLGVQVLRAGSDSGRTILTAVGLIDSEAAAVRTAQQLGGDWTTRRVRDAIDVETRGGSALISVTGRAGGAESAAQLATTFAEASLEERRERLAEQLAGPLDEVEQQISALSAGERTSGYADQLRIRRDTLRLAARTGDPTLSLAQAAPVPTGRPGQPLWLLLAAALLAGLALGAVAAVALDGVDRRLRDEDELEELGPIAVLARVPLHRGRASGHAVDEHRALISEISAAGVPSSSVVVTSASGGEGATSTAVALATALAESGRSVILADFDLRSPGVAEALELGQVRKLSVAEGEPVENGLNAVPGFKQLRVLVPQSPNGDVQGQAHLQRLLPGVVARAQELADHVVIDTAPLGRSGDALWVTREADRLVLVLRPGRTRRSDYLDLRSRLARTQTRPDGAVIVGGDGAG
jgi:Mrp family chromosome partitioning ATPase